MNTNTDKNTKTKSIYPLHAATPGAVVIIDGARWRVTDVVEILNIGNRKYQHVYCYPYLPFSKENQSNIGEHFPAHLVVKHCKSH